MPRFRFLNTILQHNELQHLRQMSDFRTGIGEVQNEPKYLDPEKRVEPADVCRASTQQQKTRSSQADREPSPGWTTSYIMKHISINSKELKNILHKILAN